MLQNIPIKRKLILISLLTTGIALLLTSALIITIQLITFQRSLLDELKVQASIIGNNSAAAMLFMDKKSAEETLKALSAAPNIVYSIIYTKDHKIFATYQRNNTEKNVSPYQFKKEGYRFSINSFALLQGIVLDKETIGYIYIQSDLNEIYLLLLQHVTLFLLGAVGAFFIALLLMTRLQKTITTPILNLVQLMRIISEERNYSIRATVYSGDEFVALAEGFNEMLGQIQKRDMEIELHRQHLEDIVSQRTAELKESVAELKKAREDAMDASKAKSAFLANMSHEIRTPMNAVVGFAELLKKTPLNKTQFEYVEVITGSANTLLDIINDILDFSKIESQKLNVKKVEFDTLEELENVIELFSVRSIEKEIDLIFFLDPKIPKRLVGDPLRIKQALTNLIGNAIKFTNEKGYVFVEIKKEETAEEEGFCTVSFSVEDNGIGIPKEKQDTIFVPFIQADYSVTRYYGGTGLGLSISQNLVRMMGGNISLKSEIGKGSRFSFTLRFETQESIYMTMPSTPDMTIALYRRDMPVLLKDIVITDYLKSMGYKTHIFSGISTLIELERTDVIFMTIPPMDTEIIKGIRVVTNAPIIAIASEYNTDVLEGSFDKIIYQPVYPSKIAGAIAEVILTKEVSLVSLKKEDKHQKKEEAKFHARALVAEDVPTNQKLIKLILNEMAIEVEITSNGLEAVEKFKRDNFDIVFMDIHMPVCNGIDATKMILEYERNNSKVHTPVIALTADAIKGEKERLMTEGMDDYLSKPINSDALYVILERYLTGKTRSKTPNFEAESGGKCPDIINKTAISLGISTDIANQLLKECLSSIGEDIDALKNSIGQGNNAEIRQISHRMKGMTANMRLDTIASLCLEIERAAKGEIVIDYYEFLDKIVYETERLKNFEKAQK